MADADAPLVIDGWAILAHPLFIAQRDALIGKVRELKQKNPRTFASSNAAKRLAAIDTLAFERIPQDPTRPEYRQGDTLGKERKHWFRAKFFQQYRLFFRYRRKERIIVYAWVNDEKTLRVYNSKTDAYATFKKMLDRDNPPDDWNALVRACKRGIGQD